MRRGVEVDEQLRRLPGRLEAQGADRIAQRRQLGDELVGTPRPERLGESAFLGGALDRVQIGDAGGLM
jgi:hypothetical protein